MDIHTLTSEGSLVELRKYMIKPSLKKRIALIFIILLAIGIIALFMQSYLLTMVCLFSMVFLFLEMYFLSKKQIQVIMKRMRELYHTDKVEGKLVFEDDAIRTINFVTNGEFRLAYDVMSLFVETENYYTLFTKEHQALIVDKQQFTPETNAQFLQLVREKMPAVFKSGK